LLPLTQDGEAAAAARSIKTLKRTVWCPIDTSPTVNVKNLEYSPDNFLLQALETASPNRIASLLHLANEQDAPIADLTAEALFLWLKGSDWVRRYRQKHGLSADWPASTL